MAEMNTINALRLNKDEFLDGILPMISYFKLTEFLSSLGCTVEEIYEIRKREHKKRIVHERTCTIINGIPQYADYWTIEGVFHNEFGPAMTNDNGYESWWLNNKMHRDNAPAVVDQLGEYWYQNGELHRLDGPAITYHDGETSWYQFGQRIYPVAVI